MSNTPTDIAQNSSPINVCISTDAKYAKYAGVVMASILQNAAISDNISFYILDGGIKDEDKQKMLSLKSIKDCEIEFVKIDEALFASYKEIKTHAYISLATYYRLELSRLIPNVQRIIYLDCDIVVNDSLYELFNTDLGDNVVGGVCDIDKRKIRKNSAYVNAGMLLMDLEKIRKGNYEAKFAQYAKEHISEITAGDQDIINGVLIGKIKLLDTLWNVQISNFVNRSSYTRHPKIIHYVAKQKPWKLYSWNFYKEYYFKYLKLTAWEFDKNEILNISTKGKLMSILAFAKYRPLTFLRPRFYKAFYETYLKPEAKIPYSNHNTFFVWEPCSKSHAEVVPGFVKYLLDLGYDATAIVHPNRLKEGLFARFANKNLHLCAMTKNQALAFFKSKGLENAKGIIVTTAGKIVENFDYAGAKKIFGNTASDKKVILVEHEIKDAVDAGKLPEDIVTLRNMDYKNAKTVSVNPHYFGEISNTSKNAVSNFVTVGALRSADKNGKKNTQIIIDAVTDLHKRGISNFKVTVIGKGSIRLPEEIKKYFNFCGRLSFAQMYNEIDKADFFLTAYEKEKPAHVRYITSGTSGNFQLMYGFLKPCIIADFFAPINGLNDKNSILYSENSDYADAMLKAINMQAPDYEKLKQNLKNLADCIYLESKENLRKLINE